MSPTTVPPVSVLVPCRNEREHLRACLDSLLLGTWPHDRLEILVLDGDSDDGTQAVATEYAQRYTCVRVLTNRNRTAPAALNLGLQHATGEIIVRADAHATYPRDYLARLVRLLESTGAENVGPRLDTVPASRTAVARAIARALSHPFGVGNSHFRVSAGAPRWVDTVPFGCFRRQLFARLGGFDETLVRNQDDEFNARIRRAGGRILLDPRIVVRYVARATLRQLARMAFQYGLYKPLVVKRIGAVTSWRQLAPAAFVASLLATTLGGAVAPLLWSGALAIGGAHLALSAAAALPVLRRDGLPVALALVAAFGVLHLSYGWGYLVGIARLALHFRRPTVATALPLSR